MHLPIFVASAAFVLSAGIAWADRPSCHWNNGRQTVRFYEYEGLQTDEARANFSVFRKMVDDEVISANQYLSTVHDALPPILETAPDMGASFSPGKLNPAIWGRLLSSDHTLLEAMDGSVLRRQQGLFVVRSDIYIATSQGALPSPVSENYVLDPDLFADARSTHLAATYLAMALQVVGKDCTSVRVKLLSKALETLQDVKSSASEKGAIEKIIRDELSK